MLAAGRTCAVQRDAHSTGFWPVPSTLTQDSLLRTFLALTYLLNTWTTTTKQPRSTKAPAHNPASITPPSLHQLQAVFQTRLLTK